MDTKYSVLMPVYFKENPEWFRKSIQSMLDQTVLCSEFVIIKDGPLTPALDEVIDEFVSKNEGLFKIVALEKNVGLGPALNRGVTECSYELIARMDSDDYSDPTRIEKELKVMEEHPEVSMVGTNVSEFIGETTNVVANCIMPETHDEIVSFSKKRNPFRHPTMLYKKSAVLAAGNYREYHLCEDYDIVVRMLKSGAICYNVQEILVFMRTTEDFYKRRGGLKYLKSIKKFKKEMLTTGYITRMQYLKTITPHIIVCLMPNFLRGFVYKHFLRKKPVNEKEEGAKQYEVAIKRKKIAKYSMYGCLGVALIGFIIGLTLTIVNANKNRPITADEFRNGFSKEVCLKETKKFEYTIEISPKNANVTAYDKVILKGDISSSNKEENWYSFQYDDGIPTVIKDEKTINDKFNKVINSFYYNGENFVNRVDGSTKTIYKEKMLLIDKRSNDNYLIFNENGLLLEAYFADEFQVNKGVYYTETK